MNELEKLREENRELRNRIMMFETRNADLLNPKVMLLEGQITDDGRYDVLKIADHNGVVVSVSEAVEFFFRANRCYQPSVATSWHLTPQYMPFHEMEESLAQSAIGGGKVSISHISSELTGYLYSKEELKVGDRDLIKEIEAAINNLRSSENPKNPWACKPWLAIRIQLEPVIG